MGEALTIGSLFSGIGGLELGLERAGLGPVLWQVEIDPFCREVLAKHWPNVTRYTDVTTVDAAKLARVDVVCGGFPCQDVSTAGRGEGLAGARSGLWREFARVIEAVRPRLVVVENVTSGARRWLPFVRRDLHMLGYRTRAFTLSAFDVGAPHMRRRVFVVAAHPERFELRDVEQWRPSRRPGRVRDKGEGIAPHGRTARSAPNPHGVRQLGDGERGVSEAWRWARDGDRWSAQPPVSGVANGISDRLDRERSLGNAVVPQCAEVIGRIALDAGYPAIRMGS